MNLREKIISYGFWVSLASAVILILKVLGSRFGFTVDETMISDLFTALCSILVILGIIVVPGVKQSQIADLFSSGLNQNKESEQEEIEDNNPQETQPQIQEEQNIIQPELCSQEPIASEPLIQETTQEDFEVPVICEVIEEVPNKQEVVEPDTNSTFKMFLENEKTRFEGNIDEFVKILQNEINSVKNDGEAF